MEDYDGGQRRGRQYYQDLYSDQMEGRELGNIKVGGSFCVTARKMKEEPHYLQK